MSNTISMFATIDHDTVAMLPCIELQYEGLTDSTALVIGWLVFYFVIEWG